MVDVDGLKYNKTALNVQKFQNDFKIPFAGYRNYYFVRVYDFGDYAYLWSSSTNVGNGYARTFRLLTDFVRADDSSFHANAVSVRCFKNPAIDSSSSEGGVISAMIDT